MEHVDNFILGAKLREFRNEKRYTLAQAAEEVHVTAAFLSMLENGKTGITINKLHALLDSYDKSLADLTPKHNNNGSVINMADAELIVSEPGFRLMGLAKDKSMVDIGSFVLHIEPGCRNEFDRHSGREYVYVLQGDVEIELRNEDGSFEEKRSVTTGDSTIFFADKQHSYLNTGEKIATVLAVEIKPVLK